MILPHRALAHLTRISQTFPKFWHHYEEFREPEFRRSVRDWPAYCYAPLAAAYAVISKGGEMPPGGARHGGELGAIAAWRPTKGIYRFDPDFGRAIAETELAKELPNEVLHRLPEWCVYVETDGIVEGVHGFFAHLECDANTGGEELRLLIDTDDGLTPIALHLVGTLQDAVQAFFDEAAAHAALTGAWTYGTPASVIKQIATKISPIVSLVLYLCSDAPDYDGADRPTMPTARQTKHGPKERGAEVPRVWDVGLRMGAALRAAVRQERAEPGDGTHASPRPHVRRAHWHLYWSGEKRGTPRVKWLSPVLVGGGENVATVREVKAD